MEEAYADYGTFKDSRKAPIHRWFQYPAGYSFKLVEEKIRSHGIKPNDGPIFDPFLGTGTTALAAQSMGHEVIGIEAHDFVHKVAKTKLEWPKYETEVIRLWVEQIDAHIEMPLVVSMAKADFQSIPELVRKCYSDSNLLLLLKIKHAINMTSDQKHKSLLELSLTATLRTASHAGTGWPYVAPSKYGSKKQEKSGLSEFIKHTNKFVEDIEKVRKNTEGLSKCTVISGDSRTHQKEIQDESVPITICSPPYLNNYDYADRTRLETYFFGHAKDWADITKKYRDKLMVAATTQTKRKGFEPESCMSEEFYRVAPELADLITSKVVELSKIRKTKGGKKSYDIMASSYFNDMLPIMQNTFRYSKKGALFVLVLGDSAPYGVHFMTETLIGELGLAIGFSSYSLEVLRERGGKWADNPQRHSVPLRECIVTLIK
ncbi:site-specific DNA-methyltransferase [Candidatus Poseidoniaceae archaeon]|nr:site-specific DNA-methyltransferase [Candidatus Poseidoniaceae archaeon]